MTTTAALGSAFAVPVADKKQATPAFDIPPDFEVKIFATDWGFQGTRAQYFEKAKAEGYDGVELWWQGNPERRDEVFALLKKHQMDVGFLCGASQPDFEAHFRQFQAMVDAASSNTVQKPLYINCHSGRDFFSFEQNKKFIEHTIAASRKTGITICHETHRSRILFAAPVAKTYFEAMPGLRMTLDISHWCNVHESFLEGQEKTIEMLLPQVDHIHARVGHPEGPQVSDPRAPEWETALNKHLAWWDTVVAHKIKQGAKRITFLTEFGPPDYMPTLAFTRQPVADQWAINVYMMKLLRSRYSGK